MIVASHENILSSRNNILNFASPGFLRLPARADKKKSRSWWCGEKDDACIVVIYLRSDGGYRFCSLESGCVRGRQMDMRLAAGGGALDDFALLDVVGVVGLDVDGEAVEGALEGLLGGGVHHAGLCGW